MSRIVRFHEVGNANVLKIEEQSTVNPKNNEVRIVVKALGINRAEVMFREGQYLEYPEFPSRLGYEASGIVDAIGSNVTSVNVGDSVSTIPTFSMGLYGVYGESAIVPEEAVAKYPENLSPEEGTAIWMAYLTVYGAIVEIGKVKPNDFVLITASSSSVGLAAIQVAKTEGANVIATTRTVDKKQFLLDAGADHVIVTNDENIKERVSSITKGKGANLIFDPIGGNLLETLAETASMGGTIIEYGALSTDPTPYPLFNALKKGLTIKGYTLFEITTDTEKLKKGKEYLFGKFKNGDLKPIIDKVFHLDEIVDAHNYMESNQQKGKIIVTV